MSIPSVNSLEAQELLSKLISFHRIHSRVVLFWGHKDMIEYLDTLVLQEREREGFPPEVFKAIHDILTLHNKDARDNCIWQISI